MKRGTIFLVLFVIVALAIVGISQFLQQQPPLEVEVVVNPLAEAWLSEAVNDFNATNPIVGAARRVQVTVIVLDDPAVWRNERDWNPNDHPNAWLPASSASVMYAAGSGGSLPFTTIADSVARTPLVWGGYTSRLDVLTDGGTQDIDWRVVADAAATSDGNWRELGGEPSWQFLKVGFAQPNQSMSGLAALLSAAAYFNADPDLSATGATSSAAFRDAVSPVIAAVPNFNTLGSDVASAMSRGPSTVEVALLPESQWLTNLSGLTDEAGDSVRFRYPSYHVLLDFPLTMWDDAQTTSDERAAIDHFRQFLLSEGQQAALTGYGLRPAQSEPAEDDPTFAPALEYGIAAAPEYGQNVVPPSRSDVLALLSWASNQ